MWFMQVPEQRDEVASRLYEVIASDPDSRLIDRSTISEADVKQISELMTALGALRDAEQVISEASQRYMQLGGTDMRALHYLIVAGNSGLIATPGAIAVHLGISSASTTKLLDRLERAGHVIRSPHPTDRRALAILITPETHEAAMQTVGRQHAKRFHAAARLTPAEREVVIRFLNDMTNEIALGSESWSHAESKIDDETHSN
ncbi:MAG: MarR family transcriptional regulator [Leucobacter sp.]|nr:MarR family transcriptional regulator [Leucobacter sp.]